MKSRTPWLVIRTLIITYLISAVLLAALSFALYRFRLPEAQVDMGVNAVYILSCLAGGLIAGKVLKTRRFFWGLLLMSLAQSGGLPGDLMHILTVLGMCAGSGAAGGILS